MIPISHSTVLVVIRDAANAADAYSQLGALLDPFDENKEMPAYAEWHDDEEVGRAVAFYREHPELCAPDEGSGPTKPFDEYVSEGSLEAWREWTRMAVGGYCAGNRDSGVYDAEKDRYGHLTHYNPRSRWDWWSLGGRWHGYFQVKDGVRVGSEPRVHSLPPVGGVEGTQQVELYDGSQTAILGGGGVFGDPEGENFAGRADLARKGDIDFETMRSLAAHSAEHTYDKFEEATKGLEIAPRFAEVRRRHFFEANVDPDAPFTAFMPDEEDLEVRRRAYQEIMDGARREYGAHPWIQALKEADLLSYFGDPQDDYLAGDPDGRRKFVERARNSATVTFAVLLDGEWYEQGQMGWWGMTTGEKDPDLWARECASKIDSLPDDVYLAVIDVHI